MKLAFVLYLLAAVLFSIAAVFYHGIVSALIVVGAFLLFASLILAMEELERPKK